MKKEKKSVVLPFRVSTTNAEKIYKWAEESGMELPEYLRRVIMRGVVFRVEVRSQDGGEVESISIREEDEGDQAQVRQKPNRKNATG